MSNQACTLIALGIICGTFYACAKTGNLPPINITNNLNVKCNVPKEITLLT